MKAVRQSIQKKDYLDALITVEKNRDGPPVGKPINIEIAGEEYDTLIHMAEKIIHVINKGTQIFLRYRFF